MPPSLTRRPFAPEWTALGAAAGAIGRPPRPLPRASPLLSHALCAAFNSAEFRGPRLALWWRSSDHSVQISGAIGDSTVPADGDEGGAVFAINVMLDDIALLQETFGAAPYDAHLRCLRVMLKTDDVNPSVAALSGLL